MLRWIRSVRFDMKTGVVIIVLALLVWAMMIYVNVRDFVPEEFTESRESPPRP